MQEPFYVSLASSMDRGGAPGDFTVDFPVEIDCCNTPYEVALTEMSYTGQVFPNLPSQFSSMSVRLHDTAPKQYQNDYIMTWDEAVDDLHHDVG